MPRDRCFHRRPVKASVQRDTILCFLPLRTPWLSTRRVTWSVLFSSLSTSALTSTCSVTKLLILLHRSELPVFLQQCIFCNYKNSHPFHLNSLPKQAGHLLLIWVLYRSNIFLPQTRPHSTFCGHLNAISATNIDWYLSCLIKIISKSCSYIKVF